MADGVGGDVRRSHYVARKRRSADDADAKDVYEVEKIVGMSHAKGKTLYRVRWQGYSSTWDTWEPYENLNSCQDMIEHYHNEQQRRRAEKAKNLISVSQDCPDDSSQDVQEASSKDHNPSEGDSCTERRKKKKVQGWKYVSSSDDEADTLKDKFWRDLDQGKIDVFSSGDLYSKVKGQGRATRPKSFKEMYANRAANVEDGEREDLGKKSQRGRRKSTEGPKAKRTFVKRKHSQAGSSSSQPPREGRSISFDAELSSDLSLAPSSLPGEPSPSPDCSPPHSPGDSLHSSISSHSAATSRSSPQERPQEALTLSLMKPCKVTLRPLEPESIPAASPVEEEKPGCLGAHGEHAPLSPERSAPLGDTECGEGGGGSGGGDRPMETERAGFTRCWDMSTVAIKKDPDESPGTTRTYDPVDVAASSSANEHHSNAAEQSRGTTEYACASLEAEDRKEMLDPGGVLDPAALDRTKDLEMFSAPCLEASQSNDNCFKLSTVEGPPPGNALRFPGLSALELAGESCSPSAASPSSSGVSSEVSTGKLNCNHSNRSGKPWNSAEEKPLGSMGVANAYGEHPTDGSKPPQWFPGHDTHAFGHVNSAYPTPPPYGAPDALPMDYSEGMLCGGPDDEAAMKSAAERAYTVTNYKALFSKHQHRAPPGGEQDTPPSGQIQSPAVGQIQNPAGGQVHSPMIGQMQSPVAGQMQSPVIGQIQSPVIGQIQSPVIGQIQSPVAGQMQSPVIGQIQSPVLGQIQSPVIGQIQSPVIGQIPDQTPCPMSSHLPADISLGTVGFSTESAPRRDSRISGLLDHGDPVVTACTSPLNNNKGENDCDDEYEFDIEDVYPLEYHEKQKVARPNAGHDMLELSNAELKEAVKANDYGRVERALKASKAYDLEQPDSMGLTLVMVTAQRGLDSLLELLVSRGGLANAEQKNGVTALMLACDQGLSCTVALLLQMGAHMNTLNHSGDTALIRSVKRGHIHIVKLLLDHGANFASPFNMDTPLKWAKQLNHRDILDMINNHISRLTADFEHQVQITLNNTAQIMCALFPMQCFALREAEKFRLLFKHELQPTRPGVGMLLFIAHARISSTETRCRLYGPCAVTSAVLNGMELKPLTEEGNFVMSFCPLHNSRNELEIMTVKAPTSRAKLVVCAYKCQLI